MVSRSDKGVYFELKYGFTAVFWMINLFWKELMIMFMFSSVFVLAVLTGSGPLSHHLLGFCDGLQACWPLLFLNRHLAFQNTVNFFQRYVSFLMQL